MKGLVVAANRLPVEVNADGQLNTSPGGLASALSSVTQRSWSVAPAPRRASPATEASTKLAR